MKKIQLFVISLFIFAVGVFATTPSTLVSAAGPLDQVCKDAGADSAVCKDENKDAQASDFVGTIVSTLLFVVGALSVVMIIVGGIFYVISQGDSSNVTKAKNTILYAVVGLIVSALAYAIVRWVFRLF